MMATKVRLMNLRSLWRKDPQLAKMLKQSGIFIPGISKPDFKHYSYPSIRSKQELKEYGR